MTIENTDEFVRCEFKFAPSEIDADTGVFSGYGAVFGNLDSHKDVIEPGAFKSTLTDWNNRGRLPAMKLMHGSAGNPFVFDDLPIGKWTEMKEDNRGLFVKGKLSNLDTDYGKRIHGLMKDGILDGLSIGYSPVDVTPPSPTGEERRRLKSVKLYEVSIVDDPSNDKARVKAVKAAAGITTIREFEDFLRDVGGYSHSAAKAIASAGFKAADTDPRDEAGDAHLIALAERIRASI
ncbi:HK97 family phage prohead protease [Mesorhizobium sp. M1A.F.Ca.ET.072.01.1.1]|uniref:HK97 family phage prohead protease n=1 Tax=Mesorhizobium sp. M1A.F.Ca.ET.072.01.1.1 TaxID=2496753 RepID=UPI000FD60369|nr:HK97 family phage prohead protease [Mesorhizobium sp. M1A.F.Ca.ET.072.01.1.1]RUW55060.1 HK97 family phage prohead protease [Mesorhizobium sp. M1A.F.Ca.ET.072.01.1.1]TIV04703.1 MAG: HK97 family phage prohead protease [Mesorhizobium sp.]